MELFPLLSSSARGALETLPQADPHRSRRLVESLLRRADAPSSAVPLLERILLFLPETPDGERALLGFERWLSRLPTPRTTLSLLREHPRLLEELLVLFGSSQYLSDLMAREPTLYALFLEDCGPRDRDFFCSQVERLLGTFRKPESRRDALRRIKRREVLRIGWRDLVRGAPLTEVVHEISDLAEALIVGALRLAREEVDARFTEASAEVRFSVIALGKLGARELNYSSDVDLLFVMDSPTPHDEVHRRYAARLAETLIQVLSAPTSEGHCLRVDMRLRPEGRAGALVRSLGTFRAYYDRWAETWERQALLKARPVAGDPELAEAWLEIARSVTFRQLQGASLLDDVREMRGAVERKLESAGSLHYNVKEGVGTIRDVEFPLQVLQLLFGADRPELQVRDTHSALDRLLSAGILTDEERTVFRAGYDFFRALEHRMQLMDDQPVRVLPTDPRALRRLARTMGFGEASELLERYREHQERVRALAERIYDRLAGGPGAPLEELRTALLSADTPESRERLRDELRNRGFPNPEQAADALCRLSAGPPEAPLPAATRRLFGDLAPALLSACEGAADPGLALEGLADFADRKLLHRALYQSLREQPDTLAALARVAGAAPVAWKAVLRYPELGDLLGDPAALAERLDAEGHLASALQRLGGTEDWDRRLALLRRYHRRELVRQAARHVLAPLDPEEETREWSHLADGLLGCALRLTAEELFRAGRLAEPTPGSFCVLGLGRLGGEDLHFSSDLDLLFLFDDGDGRPRAQYEHLARAFQDAVQGATSEGALYELDLRLRPEGRQGPAVASLSAAARYYGEGGRAETWEFQMLTRARPVAGNPETMARFLDQVSPRVYRDPYPAAWTARIDGMRRRMERERVPDGERGRHLKLDPGGLADIEFAVQLLQLRHGAANPAVRSPRTLEAARSLCGAGLVSPERLEVLEEGYRFLTRLRQCLALLRPRSDSNALPDPEKCPREAVAVARAAGFPSCAELQERLGTVTRSVREVYLAVVAD